MEQKVGAAPTSPDWQLGTFAAMLHLRFLAPEMGVEPTLLYPFYKQISITSEVDHIERYTGIISGGWRGSRTPTSH